MFDRMVNVNGVKNLIWVWTHQSGDDAWYPGDEYVDIVGIDIYKEGDHTSQVLEFNDMSTKYGEKKMVTISETGSLPDVDNLIGDKAAWSWYMVWNGDFVRKDNYNTIDLWKKMFASDYVITLDEMPDLKTYPLSIHSTGMETGQGNRIKVFPTYFTDFLQVRSGEPLQHVSIFNQLGICMKTIFLQSDTALISMNGLPSGMYLVKVDTEPVVKVFKQ